MSGHRAATDELPRYPPPRPSRRRLRGPLERSRSSATDPGPQAGTNDAGLARRTTFTRMPSASTPVCSSHHTRQSHSRRRVAFQDDEVLERRFHAAGAGRWSRSPPNHPAIATFGANLPVLAHKAEWRTVGGRCVAGICHPPTTAAYPRARGFSASTDCTSRARRSSCSTKAIARKGRAGTAHAGGDSSCDVPRPESECG
jgi:hypothetical protein